jgi:hypothetical protein
MRLTADGVELGVATNIRVTMRPWRREIAPGVKGLWEYGHVEFDLPFPQAMGLMMNRIAKAEARSEAGDLWEVTGFEVTGGRVKALFHIHAPKPED